MAFNPKDFTPDGDGGGDRQVLRGARQGVRDPPPGAGRRTSSSGCPRPAGSEAEDKAKAAAADALRRARAGEDFAKLARELSQDPGSAPDGGDLGFVSKGEMVPQFEDALFKLKKGEISPEPVQTPFGFHVIKVTDVREGGRKPKEAVAAEIRTRLAAEAAQRAAKAKADEARAALLSAKDFMAEAKSRGLTPLETTVSQAGAAGSRRGVPTRCRRRPSTWPRAVSPCPCRPRRAGWS